MLKQAVNSNLVLDFDLDRAHQLDTLLRRMGDFLATAEEAEEKMREREVALEKQILQNELYVTDKLGKIHGLIADLEEFLTAAGAARLRHLLEGHVKSLDDDRKHFQETAKESCDRLDRAAKYTIQSIAEAVGTFHINDFKELTANCVDNVTETANVAVNKISRVGRRFTWKNMALTCMLTLVVSTVIGLYLNAELPWETHNTVAQERNAGQALMNAWPHLSAAEKQRVIDSAKKSFI